jgi:hypothetical protein
VGAIAKLQQKGSFGSPFFLFSFNAVFFSLIVILYLFSGVDKKVFCMFFCGFCNFGRCKPPQKKGLLKKRSKVQLNWQMAWEV